MRFVNLRMGDEPHKGVVKWICVAPKYQALSELHQTPDFVNLEGQQTGFVLADGADPSRIVFIRAINIGELRTVSATRDRNQILEVFGKKFILALALDSRVEISSRRNSVKLDIDICVEHLIDIRGLGRSPDFL